MAPGLSFCYRFLLPTAGQEESRQFTAGFAKVRGDIHVYKSKQRSDQQMTAASNLSGNQGRVHEASACALVWEQMEGLMEKSTVPCITYGTKRQLPRSDRLAPDGRRNSAELCCAHDQAQAGRRSDGFCNADRTRYLRLVRTPCVSRHQKSPGRTASLCRLLDPRAEITRGKQPRLLSPG